MPDDMRNQLNRQLEHYSAVLGKGGTGGQNAKSIISDINHKILRYRTSHNAGDEFLGNALSDFKDVIHSQIARQDPQAFADLMKADEAFKNMTRVGRAVNKGVEGTWDTKHLSSAIRELDKSSGKRQYARGKALMQDWANTGQEALGTRINPDTAGRYGLMRLIMNPKTLLNLPAAAILGGGAAMESESAKDALAEYLMKKDSPFSEQLRKYGLSALGSLTTAQGD
jgi:hypothetical protein